MNQKQIQAIPTFPQINYNGLEWGAIKDHLSKDLEQSIKALCGDKSQEDTVKLRGRIQVLQTILGWEDRSKNRHQ